MDCSIGNVPSNFFVRPFLPQGRVLRVASALVTTANTTAVLGALTAGVPGLLVPAGGEEPDVAEQCENAGVARVLAIEMASPARLGSELRQLLEDENTKNAARRISAKFAQLDSFNITADLLERLAQAKAPVLRSEQKYVLESAI
jgi:UDP:flavonoid glycosyltransferase YjiC (YdhE family)